MYGRKKITKKGIICPNLLHDYTYNRETGPQTNEQLYELTYKDDFETMGPKLTGKPMASQHGDMVIGSIKRNWVEGNKWMIEFEVDGSLNLMAEQTVQRIEAGLITNLSLKHHHGTKGLSI